MRIAATGKVYSPSSLPFGAAAMRLALPLLAVLALDEKTGKVEGHGNGYVLWVPKSYDAQKKWPLLLLLHGAGDTAQNFLRSWEIPELTDGFFLCALEQDGSRWNDGKVVVDAAKQLSKEYAIDPSLWFIAGFSMGGFATADAAIPNYKLFPGICVIGAGESNAGGSPAFGEAAKNNHFYLLVGSEDFNREPMWRFDRHLEAAGCKQKKWVEVPGMGHTFRIEDVKDISGWLKELIRKIRLNSAEAQKEIQRKMAEAGKLAGRGPYAPALARYREILETWGPDSDPGRRAAQGVAQIEKKAREGLDRARRYLDRKEPGKARAVLDELAPRFRDTPWAAELEALRRKCDEASK